MGQESRFQRFTNQLEWRWTIVQAIWGFPAAVASFALPAWAVKMARVFEQYEPLSWVVAGFSGLGIAVAFFASAAWARGKWVRANYDARMLAQGGAVDPLEKTFERKRVYLNEFCLPSHPIIEDKTFINCEIIGPANIILVSGNSINNGRYPICDAVYLAKDIIPNGNYYAFSNCIFRGCNFYRVTFFVPHGELNLFRNYVLVKWITTSPYEEIELPLEAAPIEGEPQEMLLSNKPEDQK
jgi:hypothetical protein